MATPYMSLTLPTVSVTGGPTYASQVNTALTTIDSHTHSAGQGQQVPVSGLNINADLSLAGFNITTARTLRLQLQTVAPAANTDLGCIYATTAGDLYYRNGSGQAVQITSGSGLAAVGTGSISGLAAPATASFSSSSGGFSWRSNTNVAAGMDSGPLTIRDTGVSAAGITIASPVGIAGAYSLTLPTALPVASGLLSLSPTGVLSVFGTVSGGALSLASTLTVTSPTSTVIAIGDSLGNTISVTNAGGAVGILGNRSGAFSGGADIGVGSTATRTAGFLLDVQNNATNKLRVDYQGLLTLGSQSAPLQPSSIWTALTAGAGWTANSGLGYYKDALGVVHLRGIATYASGSAAPFTLPAGFRPSTTRRFAVVNPTAVPDFCTMLSNGQVSFGTSNVGDYYLDGVTFVAEA